MFSAELKIKLAGERGYPSLLLCAMVLATMLVIIVFSFAKRFCKPWYEESFVENALLKSIILNQVFAKPIICIISCHFDELIAVFISFESVFYLGASDNVEGLVGVQVKLDQFCPHFPRRQSLRSDQQKEEHWHCRFFAM